MKTLALAVLLAACGKSASTSDPAPTITGFHVALGDATVYELVDRRWRTRDKPARDLVLHADGKVDFINDKTDKTMMTLTVQPDGTVVADGKPAMRLTEHGVTRVDGAQMLPVVIDGDTVTVTIEDKPVKVVLAADGNVTVVDRPDGNKWRIDAADPAVRRTAFRLLAIEMKEALD